MSVVESRSRATSSEESRKDVLVQIKEQGIDDLLLWFTDLEGHLKSFSITIGEVEGALDDGMGFDGSSITGFNAIEESDMVAIPDPETYRVLPDGKTGRMICDVVTPDGEPYDGDPRYVLRRALERMESLGFDTFNVGPEAEYFLSRTRKALRRSTRAATSRRRRWTPPPASVATRSARSSRWESRWSTITTRSAPPSTR